MADPVTLAVVGATAGAALNPDDPLKGAVIGGTLGYGGATFAGLGATGGTVGAAGAAGTAGAMTPVAPAAGSLKAFLPELGVQTGASMGGATAVPGTFAAASPQLLYGGASPLALGGTQRQQLAMANNLIGGNQQQQQQQAPIMPMQMRQGRPMEPNNSVLSLLQTTPRRREMISLLG